MSDVKVPVPVVDLQAKIGGKSRGFKVKVYFVSVTSVLQILTLLFV